MPEDVTKGLGGGSSERPPIPAGKKCLLTIAIGKYDGKHGYGELRYPVPNAEGIAAELKENYGFDEVIPIKDHECTDAEIKSAITRAKTCAGEDGQLIVYFTGHGAADDEDGFWIPFDLKKEISENCSVMHILGMLVGKCAQVLVLVDCCFSGTAVDAGLLISLFKKKHLENSVFSIITAGSKYEEVPDNSKFFEALITILRYGSINSFKELTWQLTQELNYRGAKTQLIDYSIGDHSRHTFLLQRDDCVTYELARSLLELNFSKQNPYLDGATTFNLTYLRGSQYCGHDIFLQRYFLRNDKNSFPNITYPVYKISFGGEGNSASYSMWDQLARILGLAQPEPSVIIQSLMNVLKYNNFLLIAKIRESCVEGDMEIALKNFWKEIYDYAKRNKKEVEGYNNRVYFFIWDVRGNTDDISNIVTEEKFPSMSTTYAKLLPLPVITEVMEKDFDTWYNVVRNNYSKLKSDVRFKELEFDMLHPPRTVMNVIEQIEDRFTDKNFFFNLFFQQ